MKKVPSTTTITNSTAQPYSGKGNDCSDKVKALQDFLYKNKAIEKRHHRLICESFGLPYLPDVFTKVYHDKVLELVAMEPITAATISDITGLPHKYVCQIKRRLEAKGIIEVSHLGQCPTTLSLCVQFLAAHE
jgi:hypothetical protein